jgi:hypothetical protein
MLPPTDPLSSNLTDSPKATTNSDPTPRCNQNQFPTSVSDKCTGGTQQEPSEMKNSKLMISAKRLGAIAHHIAFTFASFCSHMHTNSIIYPTNN